MVRRYGDTDLDLYNGLKALSGLTVRNSITYASQLEGNMFCVALNNRTVQLRYITCLKLG